MPYLETDLVTTIEQLTENHLATLTQSQLDGIDQFHGGGADAVDRLLPSLGLTPGMTALDVGSGLGGPARQIARSTGCAVVGVDTTQSYVDTAMALTRAAGLTGQVSFIWADVTDVERDDFDAAHTMHVQMNVADKKAFFCEIASRLRPGASLATFEVCQSGQDNPVIPLRVSCWRRARSVGPDRPSASRACERRAAGGRHGRSSRPPKSLASVRALGKRFRS